MSNRYVVTRSISSNSLFNVTLVNNNGDILATYAADLSLDDAAFIVEQLTPPDTEAMTAENNLMRYSKWNYGFNNEISQQVR